MAIQATIDYTPNTAQERWHRANTKHKVVLLGAGVGVGKTQALAEESVIRALENPGCVGLVASHVFTHMKTVVRPRIISILKQAKVYKGENKADKEIYVRNGSLIKYGSANRPDSLEGMDVAWAIGDELRFWPWQSYEFFTARVRVKCPHPLLAFTSTLDSGHWMADVFRDTSEIVVRGTTYENAHNLQADYIELLKKRLSPQLFAQYALAEWANIGGTVYGQEAEIPLMLERIERLYDPYHPVLGAMDFGYVRPAFLFVQHFDFCPLHGVSNCLHILDEIVEDNTSTDRMIPKIKGKCGGPHYFSLSDIYCDPAGRHRNQEEGKRSVDILESADFNALYSTARKDTDFNAGIERVRAQILSASNERRLYIASHLDRRIVGVTEDRGIVKALQRYPYKGTPPQPHRESIYGHVLDALRYLVNGVCQPRAEVGPIFERNRLVRSPEPL